MHHWHLKIGQRSGFRLPHPLPRWLPAGAAQAGRADRLPERRWKQLRSGLYESISLRLREPSPAAWIHPHRKRDTPAPIDNDGDVFVKVLPLVGPHEGQRIPIQVWIWLE